MSVIELPQYLTPKQVAQRVNVTVETLCVWRASHKGPRYIRRGNRIYYPPEDVEDWFRNGDTAPRGG